jgi:pyruvate carboxylase
MVKVSDNSLTRNTQQATNTFSRSSWTSRALASIIRYVQLSVWQRLAVLRHIILPLTLQLILRLGIII